MSTPDITGGNLLHSTSDLAPENQLRGYVLTAMFAGVGAAAGYLLMVIPNVEAITSVAFIAGYTIGFKRGILAAVITALLYFGLNPQGGLFPPLLMAQIIGLTAAPVAGASLRIFRTQGVYNRLYLGFSALVVTLWYDLLTNLSFPLVAGFDTRGVLTWLIAGIPASLLHIATNIIIFILIIPPILNLINRRYAINLK